MSFLEDLERIKNEGAANQLAQQRQNALNQYNAKKEQLDSKYAQPSGLSALLGGIGKSIGDVGTTLYDMFGSAWAGLTGGNEGIEKFKKELYKTDNLKDAYAKSAGTALNSATTLATSALPMAGAGSAIGKALGGVAANTIGGAVGGAADELQQEGANADLGQAAKRALSGAAGGLAGGAIGGRIGSANSRLGSTLLNNKLATSTLGRGAIAGAVGGATGAGTAAALDGGDVTNAAIQGATSGALSGAAQSGLMSLANVAKQDLWDAQKTAQAKKTAKNNANTTTNVLADNTIATNTNLTDGLDIPDYTKPLDYQGNELKIEKKNLAQRIGDDLALTGERIENADLYNSLYSKTAADVVKNDTVNQLRKLGYTPENYEQAAKISKTTNQFVDDIVKNSGASIVDNGLVDRIAQPSAENAINSPTYQKVYDSTVKSVLEKIEKGNMPGKYNASDLLKASREVGKTANTYLKRATNVNGGDLATDAGALADALFDVKRELRNLASTAVDGFGDKYTKSQLSQRLKNLGATDAAIADMLEANNIGEFIRKTAKYEEAQQMANEMKANLYRRNAISGSKTNTNIINRVAQDSGVGELLSVATKPIGKTVGKVARGAGNIISSAASSLPAQTANYTNQAQAVRTPIQPMSQNTQTTLNNFIGRTQAGLEADKKLDQVKSAMEYQNLEDTRSAIDAIDAQIAALQAQKPVSQAEQNIIDIQNGMNAALAAGDITAYNQLADLYTTAYKMYQAQNPQTEESKLSTAEKNQIAKLESAGTALDQLESLYTKAGGGQGVIAGNLANFLGSLGLNSDVNTYNQLAQGLINQIGAAIGKTDSLNTEGEVQRALSLVPKITDDSQTAMNKLSTLRQLLQQNTGTYNELYGA